MSLFYQISSFNEDIVRNLQTRKAMLLAAEQLDVSGKYIGRRVSQLSIRKCTELLLSACSR